MGWAERTFGQREELEQRLRGEKEPRFKLSANETRRWVKDWGGLGFSAGSLDNAVDNEDSEGFLMGGDWSGVGLNRRCLIVWTVSLSRKAWGQGAPAGSC